MKIYCVGFMFDDEGEQMLLIQKNRPEWQVGLFNGIGGKVEISESPAAAMIREFKEEAGVETTGEDWHLFCLMKARAEALIYFYRGFSTRIQDHAKTMEDEPVSLWPVASLGALRTVPNLYWLIPMALNGVEFAEMSYPSHEATRGTQRRVVTGSGNVHSPAPEPPATQRTSPSAIRLSLVPGSPEVHIAAASPWTAPDLCQEDRETSHQTLYLNGAGPKARSVLRQHHSSPSNHTEDQRQLNVGMRESPRPQEEEGPDR